MTVHSEMFEILSVKGIQIIIVQRDIYNITPLHTAHWVNLSTLIAKRHSRVLFIIMKEVATYCRYIQLISVSWKTQSLVLKG